MLYRVLIFFISIICLGGCQRKNSKWHLTLDERESLQRVFQHVMLEEGGIYTLCGDKPITCFIVAENLKSNDLQMTHLSLKDWNIYERVVKRYRFNRFLLIKIPRIIHVPRMDPLEDGYFVNIIETTAILQEHYATFREYIGFDFDPLEQVFEIENPDSVFWNIALKNKYLLGILLGYGKENAYLFARWVIASKGVNEEAERIRSLSSGYSDVPPPVPSIQDFPLPIFRTFPSQENERYLRKYREQKTEIENAYRGRDFVELTLEKLNS